MGERVAIVGVSVSLPGGADAAAYRRTARAAVPGVERVTVYRRVRRRDGQPSTKGGAQISFELREGAVSPGADALRALEREIVALARVGYRGPAGR